MRKLFVYLTLLIGLQTLVGIGCTITKGLEERKNVETKIYNTVEAGGLMYFVAPVSTERASGDQSIPTSARVDPKTDVALSMPKGGSTSAAKAGEGLQALKDMAAFQDKRKRDSENTDNSTTNEAAPAAPPIVIPVEGEGSDSATDIPDPNTTVYQSDFHHLQTTGRDPGTSLVSCPGQVWNYEKCTSGGVLLPRHPPEGTRDSDDREGYWNMDEELISDVICEKNGQLFYYKGGEGQIDGVCK